MRLQGILLVGYLLFAYSSALYGIEKGEQIVFTKAFSGDEYGQYHIQVLDAALAATEKDYGPFRIEAHPFPLTQSRQILMLSEAKADLMWSVTSSSLEDTLLPVRFPLLQGFGGQRVFAISPHRQHDFPEQLSLEKLKLLKAVQGSDWPDYRILSEHGFNVFGADWSSWYITMYKMLERDMLHYFPRNVIEVHRDLAYHNQLEVVIEKHHLLSYPSYEYFFVRPDRPALAKRLEEGLQRLLISGRLKELFESNPDHRKALAIINDKRRTVHSLTNPILPYAWKYPVWTETPEQSYKEFSRGFSQSL